jgi:hypothetical protein
MQVFSSLNVSFQIPWPPMFVSILDNMKIANIDFMSFFTPLSPCSFSLPFLSAFYAHMCLLPAIYLCVKVSQWITSLFRKKKKKNVSIKSIKWQILFIFLLYPGIGQRVFQVFDCQRVSGRYFLRQDYSIECYKGEHVAALVFALVFLGIYVIGIPLAFLLHLRKHRARLEDSDFTEKFGSIYVAYKAQDYWFESFEMVKKIVLVGGMVLINPGSMSQVLMGFLIAFAFYTVVVAYAPYKELINTKLQILTSGQLLLALVLGLVLTTNSNTNNVEDYENVIIDILLVGSSVVVFVVSMYMMLTGIKEKLETAQKLGKKKMSKTTRRIMYCLTCACCCVCSSRNKSSKGQTKISPSEDSDSNRQIQIQQMQKLRDIRVKYGAASSEYKNAIDCTSQVTATNPQGGGIK